MSLDYPQPPRRPWYVADRLADDYCTVARKGGDLKMLKALKVLRTIIVNVAIVVITTYALWLGADPTIVSVLFLGTIGLYNGVEVADYAALAQAFAEVKAESGDDGND